MILLWTEQTTSDELLHNKMLQRTKNSETNLAAELETVMLGK